MGFPLEQNDNAFETVLTLALKGKLKMSKDDIQTCFCRKEIPGKPGMIEVKFKDVRLRDNYLKEMKKLKPNGDMIHARKSGQIYVNEKITPKLKQLYYQARLMVRDKKWESVWIYSNAIFVKKEKNGQQIKIGNMDDLQILLN